MIDPTTTTIAGIEIPSTDPVFLSIVAIHVPLGIVAVASGAIAMFSAKAPGRHPRFGTIYFWSLAAMAVSATALSVMRWSHNYHLFILGALAFGSAYFGRAARRRHSAGWMKWHLSLMGTSYVLMLTAFYVDNGRQLPLWKDLPVWTYWTLPALIGAPIMLWALRRHSLASSRTGSRPVP